MMQLSPEELTKLKKLAIGAALEAGRYIASRSSEKITVEHKEGGDHIATQVVTEVDLKSNDIIIERLFPTCGEYGLALLTEEGGDDLKRLESHAFWCVDPLDGTLSFTESVPGYSVSIALVSKEGVPLIGVIYNPVTESMYAAALGQGATLDGRPFSPDLDPVYDGRPLTAVFDPSMDESCDSFEMVMESLEAIAGKMGLTGVNVMHRGGAVVNACRVLENAPACYFKFPKPVEGGGSLWDFAASACIYGEVGAISTDFHGKPLELNRIDSTFMNHHGAMYATSMELADDIRQLIIDNG